MSHTPDTPTMWGFDLDQGESITQVIRRHPITLVPAFAASVGLTIVAGFLAYVEGRFPNTFPMPPVVVLALAAIMLVLAAIFVLVALVTFHRTALIFTNVHLVYSEQIGLFSHRVSQVHFTRIQDVTGHKHGLIENLFNFGDVEIQSAGEKTRFTFRGVRDPQEVADDALAVHEESLRALGLHEPVE